MNRWIRKDPVSLLPHKALEYSWSSYVNEVIDSFKRLNNDPQKTYIYQDILVVCHKGIGVYGFEDADDILLDCVSAAMNLKRQLPAGNLVYRGRPDYSGITYNKFTDLTSAPSQYAKANRLSQTGNSVFYGSFDNDTPVKEILNYTKGAKPIISLGMFVTNGKLNLIDFTNIPKPDFWMGYREWQTYLFLQAFHDAITKPVSDMNQHIEYVPTQIFIWMLRKTNPDVDGIIYRSSLTGKPNVCLFYDNNTLSNILILSSINII